MCYDGDATQLGFRKMLCILRVQKRLIFFITEKCLGKMQSLVTCSVINSITSNFLILFSRKKHYRTIQTLFLHATQGFPSNHHIKTLPRVLEITYIFTQPMSLVIGWRNCIKWSRSFGWIASINLTQIGKYTEMDFFKKNFHPVLSYESD